ncbi:CAZyme family GT8, partial [Penicillium angulare]|uniref:CAZyme family GT8 n=1 Tax=Penicillium angulare TaxID=116970 RepID=UPI0025415865
MVRNSRQTARAAILAILVFFGVATLLKIPTTSNSQGSPSNDPRVLFDKEIDWSRFAYTQYATDRSYLCNSLMIFEALHRLGSKADRVMLFPSEFMKSEHDSSKESILLRFARDNYQVKLKPIEAQLRGGGGAPWSKSYTKLLAFNETDYDRILNLDSDGTLLQHMDELFLSSSGSVAMPQAYWMGPESSVFTSGILLIEPSKHSFHQIMNRISTADGDKYDMEIMNEIYGHSSMVIPHRPYILLTGEFRSKNHEAYLGNAQESWDAKTIFIETKYLHFSDWPLPKPWVAPQSNVVEEIQPTCDLNPKTNRPDDCRGRDIWLGIYDDFKTRRA